MKHYIEEGNSLGGHLRPTLGDSYLFLPVHKEKFRVQAFVSCAGNFAADLGNAYA